MIEHALSGSKKYWIWISGLVVVMLCGLFFYIRQFNEGLTITGLSRDVPWGFYIAQFTFMVGVAASAVMVVLPYYLHNYKKFGKITVLGEFIAIGSCIVCMAFIFVDMGQPFRIINVFLHPSPSSMMFWDTVVLFGYLVLNIVISRVVFSSESKGIAPPKWIKPIIILSIPWAVSIHTVTAFLYAGLSGRPFFMTAIMAPRFLASAFAAGPALLIIIMLILKRNTGFDVGKEALKKLSVIIAYAMAANVFFILMEIFTGVYSSMPEHQSHFQFMYLGLQGLGTLAPWMMASSLFAIISLILLFTPKLRNNTKWLVAACIFVFVSLWIDKGLGLIITGFTPNPFGEAVRYWPTFPELMIGLAVYAMGAFIVTILYKTAITTRTKMETL
jgi:[DsrC]-trisulfide reductase subunit P